MTYNVFVGPLQPTESINQEEENWMEPANPVLPGKWL